MIDLVFFYLKTLKNYTSYVITIEIETEKEKETENNKICSVC